jgi:hypothetical protein
VMGCMAFAGSGMALRVNVPFAFYVENQLLPAGEYDFTMGVLGPATASSILVRAKDGTGIALIATRPGFDKAANAGRLRFNKYGDKRFLTSVGILGYEANLKTTNHERVDE